MTISMYQASVPVFVRMLRNLSAILDKGLAHAEARNIAPGVLPGLRLIADMFPLSKQVQIATDHAKGCVARLAGVEVPKYEDNEQTIEELKARRVDKTSASVDVDEAEQVEGFELPGADLSGEELSVRVLPRQADEFTCSRCFLKPSRLTALIIFLE